MKKLFLLFVAVACFSPVIAQRSKKPKTPAAAPAPVVDPALNERLRDAAMMEQRMLTPMHDMMIQWSGHWRDEYKVWNPKQTDPVVSRLEREGRVVLEGRFISYTVRGELGNMHYEAESALGYDKLKGVFVKTWFDNLGTAILVLEGAYDEKTNTIDFRGTATDPVTRQPVNIRQVLKILSPESHLLEVYVLHNGGKEVKTMEVKSSRN